jgi:hypothetical protein
MTNLLTMSVVRISALRATGSPQVANGGSVLYSYTILDRILIYILNHTDHKKIFFLLF